jgi:CHAT domain-containing protein
MLAATLFDSGDPARAEETVRRALEALERSGDKTYTGEALGLLGRLLEARGEHEQATATFAKALSLLREANQRYAIARVLTLWADAEIGRGEADAPLPRLEEALSLFRAIADPSSESFALYLKALALERQQRLDEATDAVAAAIERVEALRGGIVRSELRASYLSTVRSYYDLHVDLLQRRGRTTAAFEMSERSRARTLLEGLSESAARIRKGVDPELLARQRKLQAELNAKEQLRAQLADQASPRAQALGKTIERLVGEMQEVQGRIRASSPGYWALKTPTAVGVERVQKSLLDEQSALVEYHLGPKRSYAWVVDRSAVTVHELPPSARVGELARRYHELLSRDTDPLKPAERERLAADVADAGRRLSAVAWAPVEARVRGKRLLIVADGALQYVPFAALPGGTGEPLLAEHEIAYLPSASVFDSLRRGSRRIATGSAAVFADPVFARDDPRVAGAGLASAPDAAADVGVSRSALRAAGGGFPRLRFSRREAETIAAAAGARTFEALDFSASKKTLLERDLRGYRILHFATHGVLNTQHPELSGLVFSLVDKAGKPVDGFLRLHEIYNLDLDADLVVLSACRTALGKEVHGEGLIGLTRGFLYAGASRIVSSVWNVDDRASALLMSRFYTAMLAKGASPAAALREAQLSLLREPRWANPHYWAAFGLQGEWR